MKTHNIQRDIALIAKELGLEDNFIKPTGEGIKGSLKKAERDLNSLRYKLDIIREEQRDIKLKIEKLQEKNPSLTKRNIEAKGLSLGEEDSENSHQINFKVLFFYLKKMGRFLKPFVYAFSVGMLYFLGKKMGIDIPLIPFP